jgi:cobalt-zinc-cadmium efflux system membrane fusion protein
VPGVLRLSPEGQREAGVAVEAAARRPVESVRQVEGVVDLPPDRRASVSAQLAGTLDWVGVDRGQQVKAGQEIARVSSLELQTMQLDLLKADLELRLTEDTLGRLRKMQESVAARKLWETESRRNVLRQTAETLGRKLLALGLSAGQLDALRGRQELVRSLPVRATISGRVARFDRALGQALKAEEVLFEVHDLSEPLIQGFVAESDLIHVRPGQRARVRLTADPAFVGDAAVLRSGRVFGSDSRILSVWVKLDRPPATPLLHNQLARLTLVRGRAGEGVAVPPQAVVQEGARSFVFVRRKDGAFDRRAVELGAADDRLVLVTGGLSEGEPVAVAGATALQTAFASIR